MEWRALVALADFFNKRRISRRLADAPAEAESTAAHSAAHTLVPSRGALAFWLLFPWLFATLLLLAIQATAIALVSLRLEPVGLAHTWLLAGVCAIIFGWCVLEPLVIIFLAGICAQPKLPDGEVVASPLALSFSSRRRANTQ